MTDYLIKLEEAITLGETILIEDIGEYIDPVLYCLLDNHLKCEFEFKSKIHILSID